MSITNFDITTSTVVFEDPWEITNSAFDLTEFNNDSRGTPRVADWDDVITVVQSENDYDSLLSHLNISVNQESFWIGAKNTTSLVLSDLNPNITPNPYTDYNWVAMDSNNGNDIERAFFFKAVSLATFGHDNIPYTSVKHLGIGSVLETDSTALRTKQALVYFPNSSGPSNGTGSAVGDPHIKTFDGTKYTL